MSYTVVKEGKGCIVVENDTNYVMCVLSNAEIARKVCRGLNLGTGFDGSTPKFFSLRTIEQ